MTELEKAKQKLIAVSRHNITSEEVLGYYEDWSNTFHQDTLIVGSILRPFIGKELVRILGDNKNAKILDLGAASGRLGQEVFEHGFTNIDGIDACQSMLDQAKKLGVYKNLICDFLGKNRLAIDNDTYDVLMSVGLLIPGHMTDDAFEELHRITKPGGHMLLVMGERYFLDATEYANKTEGRIYELQEQGVWQVLSKTQLINRVPESNGLLYVIQNK